MRRTPSGNSRLVEIVRPAKFLGRIVLIGAPTNSPRQSMVYKTIDSRFEAVSCNHGQRQAGEPSLPGKFVVQEMVAFYGLRVK